MGRARWNQGDERRSGFDEEVPLSERNPMSESGQGQTGSFRLVVCQFGSGLFPELVEGRQLLFDFRKASIDGCEIRFPIQIGKLSDQLLLFRFQFFDSFLGGGYAPARERRRGRSFSRSAARSFRNSFFERGLAGEAEWTSEGNSDFSADSLLSRSTRAR